MDIETLREGDDFITTFRQSIIVQREKQVDEVILQTFYEIYKDKASEVIVINETEFEEFLKKYLPIYAMEKNNGTTNRR